MHRSQTFIRLTLVIITIMTASAIHAESAFAAPVVKLSGEGLIQLSTEGSSRFVLQGNASHLGNYTCFGEVVLASGAEDGLLVGQGVTVIQAANGDLIVGIVTFGVDAKGNPQVAFSWRDSVVLSDGTVVANTGRFVKSPPAGAVSRLKSSGITDGTSNIIAILIG